MFNKKSSKDIHPHLSYLDLHFIVSINFQFPTSPTPPSELCPHTFNYEKKQFLQQIFLSLLRINWRSFNLESGIHWSFTILQVSFLLHNFLVHRRQNFTNDSHHRDFLLNKTLWRHCLLFHLVYETSKKNPALLYCKVNRAEGIFSEIFQDSNCRLGEFLQLLVICIVLFLLTLLCC